MKAVVCFVGAFLLSCCVAAGQLALPPRQEPIDVGRALDRKLEKVAISSKELPDALAELGKLAGRRSSLMRARWTCCRGGARPS